MKEVNGKGSVKKKKVKRKEEGEEAKKTGLKTKRAQEKGMEEVRCRGQTERRKKERKAKR